jgi:hypothetical protein
MLSACSVLHTFLWGTQGRLAILRLLARGLLCTIWTMPSSSSTPSLTSRSAAMQVYRYLSMSGKLTHSSGWYSTVRKTSLIFSYGMNWITVTKTVHVKQICTLCNWKCKRHRTRNTRTEMRIRTGLTGTLHCRFYRPRFYETISVLFWSSGGGTVGVM